ncbi:MAG TPA: rhomboid family intramembrane serine protease [Usitatibacter sp.]|nr:rhomboid family intramembrane serine protease [Usitatibacter sp.]
MNGFPRSRRPVATVALIAACVAVSIASSLGQSERVVLPLLIAEPGTAPFAQVLHGEVWRLVTPMLVHFGVLHILFNMMWMWDLGRLTELVKGSAFLLAFVIVTGIASNVAQYLITGNPLFGGMSGVVYALLGYVWMQGRHNPRFGYALHKSTVAMMLGWYVLCWTGLLGPIANWAHTAGLVLGVAWGYLQAKMRRT